jgi:hypothetical protein
METEIATARRNLAQRIERFLAKRRADGAPLTVEESTNLGAALDHLESGRSPAGEDAMMLAEKGWAARGEIAKATTTEALGERLTALVRA